MRTPALLLLCPLMLAACASLQPADPATMDCAALTQALAQTRQQLQDERQAPRSPVQLNIGLGGAIGSHGSHGSHGSAGIGFGVPLGTAQPDPQRIAGLERRLLQLQQLHQQRQCPPLTITSP